MNAKEDRGMQKCSASTCQSPASLIAPSLKLPLCPSGYELLLPVRLLPWMGRNDLSSEVTARASTLTGLCTLSPFWTISPRRSRRTRPARDQPSRPQGFGGIISEEVSILAYSCPHQAVLSGVVALCLRAGAWTSLPQYLVCWAEPDPTSSMPLPRPRTCFPVGPGPEAHCFAGILIHLPVPSLISLSSYLQQALCKKVVLHFADELTEVESREVACLRTTDISLLFRGCVLLGFQPSVQL